MIMAETDKTCYALEQFLMYSTIQNADIANISPIDFRYLNEESRSHSSVRSSLSLLSTSPRPSASISRTQIFQDNRLENPTRPHNLHHNCSLLPLARTPVHKLHKSPLVPRLQLRAVAAVT